MSCDFHDATSQCPSRAKDESPRGNTCRLGSVQCSTKCAKSRKIVGSIPSPKGAADERANWRPRFDSSRKATVSILREQESRAELRTAKDQVRVGKAPSVFEKLTHLLPRRIGLARGPPTLLLGKRRSAAMIPLFGGLV